MSQNQEEMGKGILMRFQQCSSFFRNRGRNIKSTDLLSPSFCHPHTKYYQISQALPLKSKGQFAKYNAATSE